MVSSSTVWVDVVELLFVGYIPNSRASADYQKKKVEDIYPGGTVLC